MLTVAVEITEQARNVCHPGRRVHAAVLEHDAHPFGELSLLRRGVEPEHAHAPAAGPAKAFADLDRGGLPGSVGPEHRGDGARLCSESHTVDCHEISVAHPEVLDAHSRIGHTSRLRRLQFIRGNGPGPEMAER